MRLLLTGFEPFAKQPINVSEKVVQHFAESGIAGIDLQTAVLPVDRFEGPDQLLRAFIKTQPDVVLSLGQANGRSALSIERVAINLLDFTTPDNGGNLETDKPIHSDGPAAYFSSLPSRAMMSAMQAANIPVHLSLSAGAYLCNQIMYEMLHYIQKFKLTAKVGFIHLPLLPEQAVAQNPQTATMSLETICQGVEIGVLALLEERSRRYAAAANE